MPVDVNSLNQIAVFCSQQAKLLTKSVFKTSAFRFSRRAWQLLHCTGRIWSTSNWGDMSGSEWHTRLYIRACVKAQRAFSNSRRCLLDSSLFHSGLSVDFASQLLCSI